MAWDFSTEPEFEAKLAWMREFVREEIFPLETLELDRPTLDRATAPLKAQVKEQGLWAAHLEPELGGGGFGQVKLGLMHEILGQCAFAPSVFGNNAPDSGNAELLSVGGTPEQQDQWMTPLLEGKIRSCFSMTEPGAGADPTLLSTEAVRDGDEWVINGSKLYITNGTQADWLCLLARTSDEGGYRGISQIIVETSTPGFAVSRKLDKLGNRSSDTAELFFEDVRVPVSNTIGQVGRGFQQQMAQFVVERMFAAYGAVGSCRRALERTRDHLKQREAFGRPLMANQYVAFRLAELSAQVDLLQSHNYACAEAYLNGEDTTRQATVAKLTAGRLLREVADTCLQFHGGMGYMEENWTSRFFRDSRLASIGGGADEVMLQVLARMDGFDA
jgi:citronellyl-CoA dehydrogenase